MYMHTATNVSNSGFLTYIYAKTNDYANVTTPLYHQKSITYPNHSSNSKIPIFNITVEMYGGQYRSFAIKADFHVLSVLHMYTETRQNR